MLSHFWKNAYLPQKGQKRAKVDGAVGKNQLFFVYYSKLAHKIFLIFCIKLEGIKGLYIAPDAFSSAKFSFSQKREKRVQKWAK